MSSESNEREGSNENKDIKLKMENPESGFDLSDVKISTEHTIIDKIDSGIKKAEDVCSGENFSEKQTSKSLNIAPDSHKDFKKMTEGGDLKHIKEDISDYCSYLNLTCPQCKNFYSYKDNNPCIMKCGISICEKCVNSDFNCKDCESVEEENFPRNIINKDLNLNNSLILKAQQNLNRFTDSQKK